MEFNEIIKEIEKEFRKKMNALGLPYHNWRHVTDFATALNNLISCHNTLIVKKISEEERENAIIAGYLHEIGIIEELPEHKGKSITGAGEFLKYRKPGHEERGIKMAGKFLKEKIPAERIARIQKLIKATEPNKDKITQNSLEKMMIDADLQNKGREFNESLNSALNVMKEEFAGEPHEWLKSNEKFLEQNFHSEAARIL
ncbi:MAG: hypothetical protein ABIA76_02950 [Candidatus Diapherotrites archaeon]